MKWRIAVLAGVALLAACGKTQKTATPSPTPASACRSESFEGNDFTVCVADPAIHRIRTVLADEDGLPLRDLSRLAEFLGDEASDVVFAVNGGMYDDAGQPIGYYVEDGERLKTLNRNEGGGNFHLLPNGVFSVEPDGWHVRTAEAFAEEVSERPHSATQSGPMLVIGGELHPDIDEDGPSKHIRNGVGIDGERRAVFVISEQAVSFGKLARLFRDKLGCAHALYLDGAVSALWNPAFGRIDRTVPLGPLIVVEKDAKADPVPDESPQ